MTLGHSVRVIAPVWAVPRPFHWLRPDLAGLHSTAHVSESDGSLVLHPRMLGLPGHPLPRLTERSLVRRSAGLLDQLGEWSPDMVICHTLWPVLSLASRLAMEHRAPIICWLHGWDADAAPSRVRRRIRRLVSDVLEHSRLKGVVIVSERHRTWVESLIDGAVPVHLMPCPTMLQADAPTEPAEPADKEGSKSDLIRVLFPASPHRRVKDVRLFDAVVAELRHRGSTVAVTYLDHLPPEAVQTAILDADIVLMTSRREASPLVPREAVALGRRVAAVPVGDLVDWMPRAALSRSRAAGDVADAVLAAMAMPIESWSLPDIYSESHHRERLARLLADED